MWKYEKETGQKGFKRIAGVDEVGRGPIAGPVLAAAVILPDSFPGDGINDSKKLSPKKRDLFFDAIYRDALGIGIGIVDNTEIDRINILRASLLAMALAVKNLSPSPDFLLIDGKFTIESALPQQAIIKGDSRSISIAAASIVAKVSRDRLMERYDEEFPEYGFKKHKGYPTKAHKAAVIKHGPTIIHRRSFKGVKEHFVQRSLFQC